MTDHRAIIAKLFERAGSASELARRLGITPAAVLQWDKVPPGRVLACEIITGVSRHEIRPDVFGEPPRGVPSEAA
jgi:DNA-binding transcriptional regulator YdaS (Cro superfamily)